MKMVYISSAYSRIVKKHSINANIYCRFAYEKGVLPIAPHIILPRFLDEESRAEQRADWKMRKQLIQLCAEVWAFGMDITKRMEQEIEYAKQTKIKVVYFTADMEPY